MSRNYQFCAIKRTIIFVLLLLFFNVLINTCLISKDAYADIYNQSTINVNSNEVYNVDPFPAIMATADHHMNGIDGTQAFLLSSTSGVPASIYGTNLVVNNEYNDKFTAFNVKSGRLGGDTTTIIGEQPEGDEAYISSLEILNTITGTAPWDSNDEPGNDSTESNNIVRTMDAITYELEYVVTPQNDAPYTYYKNARIGFQVVLPIEDDDKARFDVDSLGWVDRTPGYEPHVDIKTIDGQKCQVLTAYRKIISTDDIPLVVPGTGTVQFIIDVGFMNNGDKITPDFYSWVEGNNVLNANDSFVADSGICTQHGFNEAIKCESEETIVSATPRYNVRISAGSASYLNGVGTWDFSTGNDDAPNKEAGAVNGRIYGFTISLQLRNTSAEKQLRGIEIPEGPITFDLQLSSRLRQDGNSDEIDVSKSEDFHPLLWAFEDHNSNSTKNNGRKVALNGNTYSYVACSAPLNNRGTDIESLDEAGINYDNRCFDGGTWSYTENKDGTISVMVSDYTVDPDWFPCVNFGDSTTSSAYYKFGESVRNIGVFSTGALYAVQPYNSLIDGTSALDVYDCDSTATFTMSLSDSNLSAQSVSGIKLPNDTGVGNQMVTNDDSIANTVAIERPGDYSQRVQYSYYGNSSASESGTDRKDYRYNYSRGDDSALIGSKLSAVFGSTINPGSANGLPVGAAYLLKIDPKAIEIDYGDDNAELPTLGSHGALLKASNGRTNVYLAAKPDGSAWDSWDEQKTTAIQDLVYYSSRSELNEANATCLGVLVIGTGADGFAMSRRDTLASIPLKVKDDPDIVGYAAPLVSHCMCWSRRQFVDAVAAETGKQADATILESADFVKYLTEIFPDPTKDPGLSNMPEPTYNIKTSWNYVPAYYDSNGYAGGHVGTYNYGDTLYIAGEYAKVTKNVAQTTSSGNEKTIFDMDYTQRYADYVIKPTIDLENANISDAHSTTIKIDDKLPAGLSYVPNSSYIGGEYQAVQEGRKPGVITGGTKSDPLAVKNEDGTTSLTWTIKVSDDEITNNSIPYIYYSCMIGTPGNELTDVVNNQELTNSVQIVSTYDKRKANQDYGNMDSSTIRISKLRQSSLSVSADQMFYEVSTNVGFTSNTGNYGENTIVNAFSIGLFPYNEDGRSSYHGTYSLASIKIDPEKADGDISDIRLYLTCDSKWRNKDYETLTINDIRNDNSWIEVTILPDGTCTLPNNIDLGNVVGWATTDDRLEPDMSMSVAFQLAPSGNMPEDAYSVSWTDSDNIVNAISYIVGRQVSGHVFYDIEENGSYDEGNDPLVPGCLVSLITADTGELVNNMKGVPCQMTVGEDAEYLFTDLPEGNFKIKIEPPSDTDWTGYKTTIKDSTSADDTVDSDADGTIVNDKLIEAIISNINMPSVEEMSNSVYSLEHMDAGIVPPFGFLELTKSSGNSSITNGNNNYSLSGAVYGLWKDDPNCTANNETARITTDSNGHAASEELRNGTYYIKEITPSKGYKLDTNIYTATVLPTKTTQVTSNGNNTLSEPPETITTPTIIKTDAQSWTHGTTTVMNAALANAEFTIKFYTTTNTDEQQSATPERTWVLKSDSNGRIIFDNAHKVSGDEFYTDDNSIILPLGSISWQETKAPTGYVLDNTIHRLSLPSGTETAGTLTATNEPIETSIAITKIWDDDNDRDGLRNDAVFTVIGSVAGSGDIVYNGTLTVKAPTNNANTATATLENLPAYANGLPVTYTYTEKATTGYTQSLDKIKGTWEDGYTATTTNKHIIQREEYKVKKTWDDDDDRDGLRPDSILFTLTGSDGSTRQVTAAMNAWSASFGSLPVYYNHGTRIEYTLTEANVNGYTLANQTKKAITDNTGKTTGWEINITNTHEPETTSYTAHKTWNDDNDRDGLRPDTLPITLTGSDGSVRTLNATAGNNWSVTFDNLPVKFNHGRNIEYTINENDVPDGYTLDNTTRNNNSYEFVNTHKPRLISIPVVKQWDDDDNRDGLREQDISVTLRGSDGSTRTATFGADDDWSYTFADLPYYFANGARIDYTLTETPVNGYTDEIIENITDDTDSFVITNTHVPAKTSLYVHKTWDDDGNRDGLRSDSIKVTLTGNDGSTREATYDAESGYSGVFTDLPVYYDNGKTIEYSLTEESIDGYQTTITPVSGDSLEGFEIANKHDVAKRSISIVKTFLDDDDRDGVRPGNIGFVLNGSDGSTREGSISAENDWATVISDLPVYYDNGTFIDYTVVEDDVPDYTLDSIDYAAGEDGYDNGSIVITNKHDIAVMDIAIDKKWIDDADADADAVSGDDAGSSRPDSVDVFVDGDDGGSYDVSLSSSDDWHTVLENVPVYRNGGQKVAYTVREGDVDGYENVRVEVGLPSLIGDDDGTVKRVLSCEVVNKEIIVPVDLPVPDIVPSIQPPRDNGVADILELAKTGDSPLVISAALLIATITASATAIALLIRKKKQQ